MIDLVSLLGDLTEAFLHFNDLIDAYVPDDAQAANKLVRIVLDRQKLTDPKHFFDQMDGTMNSIRDSYKNFVTSDLFQPSLVNAVGSPLHNYANLELTMNTFLQKLGIDDSPRKLLA